MAASPHRTVGLIGLGNLGRPIGLNLVDRGWTVRALDRSTERLAALLEVGVTRAAPGDLADCDVLCFVVPDEAAIWELLRGPAPGQPRGTGADGRDSADRAPDPAAESSLLDRLGPGTTVIVVSTILPTASRELADAVRGTGAGYVEAPVTGGPERARSGELTVFLGGSDDDLAAAGPLVEAIGSEHHRMGDVGAAAATKLANQLIMFSAWAGIHEAVTLAKDHGVAEQVLLDALASGTADTWVGRNWGFFDRVAADYDAAGVPLNQRPWSKDLAEVVAAAQAVGHDLPLARLLAGTVPSQLERHAESLREVEHR